jgi:hypothetical protein
MFILKNRTPIYALKKEHQIQNRLAKPAQHRVHRTSAGRWPHFGILSQEADSASGGFVR